MFRFDCAIFEVQKYHNYLLSNVFEERSLEMELCEEIDTLRAILMNDVIADVSDGVVRVDMKLEGCRAIVLLQGIIAI